MSEEKKEEEFMAEIPLNPDEIEKEEKEGNDAGNAALGEGVGKLLDSFISLDENRDGYVTLYEMKPLLQDLGFNLKDPGMKALVDVFDDPNSGELDFLEFVEFFGYMCRMIVKKDPEAAYMDYL